MSDKDNNCMGKCFVELNVMEIFSFVSFYVAVTTYDFLFIKKKHRNNGYFSYRVL